MFTFYFFLFIIKNILFWSKLKPSRNKYRYQEYSSIFILIFKHILKLPKLNLVYYQQIKFYIQSLQILDLSSSLLIFYSILTILKIGGENSFNLTKWGIWILSNQRWISFHEDNKFILNPNQQTTQFSVIRTSRFVGFLFRIRNLKISSSFN